MFQGGLVITTCIRKFRGGNFASVFVAFAKVSFRNGELAVGAVSEFDTSITTSIVRTNEFSAMFDILRNNKIGSLIDAKQKEEGETMLKIQSIHKDTFIGLP
jgi:hypothetical protein